MSSSNVSSPAFDVVHGDGASMTTVHSGSAQLVLTSPPYFEETDGPLFHRTVEEQDDFEGVQRRVFEFAESLDPVYREIARVLSPGGALVVQVKDLRYQRALMPLAARHVELATRAGLRLVGRVYWQKIFSKVARSPHFKRSPRVGGFKVDDCEEFQIFAHPGGPERQSVRVELDREEIDECAAPLWRMPALGAHSTHPYQSPTGPLRRMVALFTSPGDLVVDPFAGHGTALKLAVEMERRAIGYEIDGERADFARQVVARAVSSASRRTSRSRRGRV
jgi:DNA modification methylase